MLRDTPVKGRTVLLRVDYNIPPDAKGALIDDYRLQASVDSIRHLAEHGAKTVILTHRGRPQGRVTGALSTQAFVAPLSELVGRKIDWLPDCVGRMVETHIAGMAPGDIVLLENTRFHLGEQLNQQQFVKKLAALGDLFVNDAFATAHRPHASVSGLAAAMTDSVLGIQMEKELEWLDRIQRNPKRPSLMILGGAQAGAKIELIQKLISRTDMLMIGGALAHTFLAARDVPVGRSMFEPSLIDPARDLLAEAGVLGCRLLLPTDVVIAKESRPETPIGHASANHVGDDEIACDLGPQTLATWSRVVQNAGTIVWIGTLGAYEYPAFRDGTLNLANAVAQSKAFSLLAGDGLLRALRMGGIRDQMPAVSTAGVALMEALSGKPLPALTVLNSRAKGWGGSERRRATQPATAAV